MVRAQDLMIDRRSRDLFLDAVGDKEIVDPPSGVVLAGLEHVAPPGVGTLCIRVAETETVRKTGIQKLGKAAALFVRETGITTVGCGIFQVNFLVGNIQISTNNNGLLSVELLQKIRDHFKAPVTINSAYRNHCYNKKVGGASGSMHLYGAAADIRVKGVAPKDVAAYAELLMPNKGGIGIYPTFVHVDVRAVKSRWRGN